MNTFIQQLRSVGKHNGHRYLLFLSGSSSWAQAQLGELDLVNDESLLLAESAVCGLSPNIAKRHLGQEFSTVVIDAYSWQSVDDWLAAVGTLRAGGILIFMCPELDEWPPYFQSRSDLSNDESDSFFIQRVLSYVSASDGVYHLSESDSVSNSSEFQLPSLIDTWEPMLPSRDQQIAVEAILKVVRGRAKRPLVIRSDRGRGKTSALGIAAAALFKAGDCQRIAITAPHQDAVAAAFRQLHQELPGGELSGSHYKIDDCEMTFLPAFELCDETAWDLVFVDEAAALPIVVLEKLVRQHPRLVFSTTVHGYEGSGRGFDIRFKEILDSQFPQWRRAELREPVRWAVDDPLEHYLSEAFLLNAEPILIDCGDLGAIQFRVLDKEELAQDAMVKQVFGLLVQAHYQTSPRDLQHLLDSSCILIVAECEGWVVGVCQLLPEGRLGAELVKGVIGGERRPKGHLVAQRLAHINARAYYAECLSYRVNRIAVAVGQRRLGVGRELLSQAERYTRNIGAAYLTSSFAATPDVIDFWQHSGFTSVWLGSRRDTSSGVYSFIVAKSLDTKLVHDFDLMHRRLMMDVPLTLRHVHSDMTADTLVALLIGDEANNSDVEFDLRTVKRYCDKELIFEQAAASMIRLCCRSNMQLFEHAELAVSVLLLGRSWARVSVDYNLSGRAEVEDKLRMTFAQITRLSDKEEKE
jgi:tRNA(Met) cytidine acetyltransferase